MCIVLPHSLFCTYVATEAAFQYEGGVRLAYGQYSSEGILEVFIFNQWYTLCIDELPASAVTAVCTQLGYTNYVEFSDVRFVWTQKHNYKCIV